MQRIVSAAAREFMDSGFRGATTAAIARRADVTEAQLFRYFDSKADLFRAAIFEPLNRRFSDFNARKLNHLPDTGNVRDQARQYITDLQAFIDDNSEMLMCLLVAEAYSAGEIEGLSDIDALGDYFVRGAAAMARRVDAGARVDPRLMVRVSFAAVLANVLFRQWLFPRSRARETDIDAAIVEFVIDAISANADPGLARTTT
jgi:AcrR family transcriptional regulator